MLRWKPSKEGYTESHCGRFSISPVYWGRCNATGYKLEDAKIEGRWKQVASCDTQAEAKRRAQEIADKTI